MTDTLYQLDSYLRQFTAVVAATQPEKNAIALDRTRDCGCRHGFVERDLHGASRAELDPRLQPARYKEQQTDGNHQPAESEVPPPLADDIKLPPRPRKPGGTKSE